MEKILKTLDNIKVANDNEKHALSLAKGALELFDALYLNDDLIDYIKDEYDDNPPITDVSEAFNRLGKYGKYYEDLSDKEILEWANEIEKEYLTSGKASTLELIEALIKIKEVGK